MENTKTKLGNLGDVNPIEYGGGYVFAAPDVDGPWLEYYYGLDSEDWGDRVDDPEDSDNEVEIYRVDVGPDAIAWHSWVDWIQIARFTGVDASFYLQASEPMDVAQAIADAASYHGWENFDSYPLTISLRDLATRWDG